MLKLHANVYALPANAVEGPTRPLRGLELPTLQGVSGGPPLFVETLPVTFEEAQRRLMELPRCDCEPDGFFLVTGHADPGHGGTGHRGTEHGGDAFWRLNGHMHEYQPDGADEPAMHRIELNGECPVETFDAVLGAMGWPVAVLAFELVQEGVTLGEGAFRQYAGVDTTPEPASKPKPPKT